MILVKTIILLRIVLVKIISLMQMVTSAWGVEIEAFQVQSSVVTALPRGHTQHYTLHSLTISFNTRLHSVRVPLTWSILIADCSSFVLFPRTELTLVTLRVIPWRYYLFGAKNLKITHSFIVYNLHCQIF